MSDLLHFFTSLPMERHCIDCGLLLTKDAVCPHAIFGNFKCGRQVHGIHSDGTAYHVEQCPACEHGHRDTEYDE